MTLTAGWELEKEGKTSDSIPGGGEASSRTSGGTEKTWSWRGSKVMMAFEMCPPQHRGHQVGV